MKWLVNILSRVLQKDSGVPESRRIIESTIHSLMIQAGSVLLLFAGNVIMARWAGPLLYGEYVHVFNWISILSVVVLWGLEDIAVARIPRYLVNGQGGQIRLLVRKSNGFIFLSSLLVAGCFLLAVYLLPLRTLHQFRLEFTIAIAAVYLGAFLTLNQSILQALHHIRLSQVVEKLIKPLLTFIFFAAIALMAVKPLPVVLMGVPVIVTVLCCMVLLGMVVSKTGRFSNIPVEGLPEKLLGWKAFHFFSIDLLNLLCSKTTMLVLAFYSLQEEVGIFNVSYRFADLVIFPFFLMSSVMPQLFARYNDSEPGVKQSLYSHSTRVMILLTLPLFALNVLCGHFFLGWFGKDFSAQYAVLVWLSTGQLLFSLFGPAHYILSMQGKEKYAVYALIVYLAVLATSNCWLIPKLGVVGGTMGVVAGSLSYNVVLAILAYRHCGVLSPVFLALRRWFGPGR